MDPSLNFGVLGLLFGQPNAMAQLRLALKVLSIWPTRCDASLVDQADMIGV